MEFGTLTGFLKELASKPIQKDLAYEGVIRMGEDIVDSLKVARSKRGKGFQARGNEIDTDELAHVIRTRPTLSLISRAIA